MNGSRPWSRPDLPEDGLLLLGALDHAHELLVEGVELSLLGGDLVSDRAEGLGPRGLDLRGQQSIGQLLVHQRHLDVLEGPFR